VPSLSAIAQVLTVGHSTHDAEAFLALLGRTGIAALVDVRRYPSSRRFPHFNSEALEASLAGAGVRYLHLEELGGRRDPVSGSPNTGWKVGQFRGYADHMASGEFEHALQRVIELAEERRTAVMCAEAQWWRCHRRLLSDALVVRGHEVLHVDTRGKIERHELTEFAVVEEGRLTYPPTQGHLPEASGPGF
jgi:uncharacterized protein (DUF488 family)